ncbi:MAG: dethiobiotin synthase [Proteobacteria bacterium]|nr:dethiobiotin synthase [Pseudomonadota bacterium]MBU1737241.1 dethiobiotin synthase [Pseudomonadota bacterium]
MTNKALFITATDTGVGKTLVSGLLLEYLLRRSIKAGYQKWVSTGDADNPADLAECMKIAGAQPAPNDLDSQVPFRFSYPASPHFAAEIDGKEVDAGMILRKFAEMNSRYEFLIVEGVGGLLVPLRRDLLLADLLTKLELPTVIVARSGLGTLNHTLLTIEALRNRKLPIAGVIFTDPAEVDETLALDNIRTIAEIGRVEILGRLPYSNHRPDLIRHFSLIGSRMVK